MGLWGCRGLEGVEELDGGEEEPLGGRRGQSVLTLSPSLSPQWDLVSSYRQLRQMAQSIYMAGVLVGALVLGGLSDR